MIRKVLTTFLLLFLAELSLAQTSRAEWVDSVYSTLTLDQRLGQLFIFPAHGSGNEQHINVIKNTIDRYTLGGLKIIDGSAESVIELNQQLRKESSIPLITAINISHGPGGIINKTLNTPSPLTLGAISSDSLLINLAQLNAHLLKELGINLAIQDGLELSDNPNLSQSFSSSFSIATKRNNILAESFKHENVLYANTGFPGTDKKSSKKALEEGLVLPYRSAILNEVPVIIMSNTCSPIDTKNISSLSKNTIDYLRKDLAFEKLLVADDLSAIKKYKPGKTEALAIESGNDLIVSSNITNSIKQIKRAIKKGDILLAQIENSVKKVLAAKFDLLEESMRPLRSTNITTRLNNGKDQAFVHSLYAEALTVYDASELLPVKQLDEKTFASLSIGSTDNFEKSLDKFTVFNHYSLSSATERLRDVLPLFDYVVVGITEKEISNELVTLLNSLNNKVIVCTFGPTYSLAGLDQQISKIISYEDNRINQIHSAELIFGAIENNGKLPLDINNHLALNTGKPLTKLNRLSYGIPENVLMDSRILNKINEVVTNAIREEATPGCQVVVARKGKVIFNESYGYYTYDSIQPVSAESIYDIASITKVAATTQAMMMLEERGMIDLDKKISVYLEDLKETNKEDMTIRDILTHQSGLWPYLPFWKETLTDDTFSSIYYSFNTDDDYPYELSEGVYISNITRDSVWQWVKNSKLRTKEPGATYDYKYSDMGYYMLQRLIEQLVNQPMEEFLQQNLYDPMGLTTMSYLPLCKFPQDIIAPTENDNYFRKSLVNGWVHDQGAAMMGGVAGHAGLFSNALDLAKLMQMHLQNGTYGGNQYYMPETLEKFTSVQYESNRRGIGWDKPVVGEWNSPTSSYASKKSFGHTGFTGTAVWADPEFDLVYVFLSNRIYPDANNRKLIKNNIRTRIQDLIYQSIWSFAATHTDSCN